MTETHKLRVFLCHSSQDKPIVRELYQRLNSEGWIDPWLDVNKLLPGQDWRMAIEQAVETADNVVICLSNHSVTKDGYVQKEMRYAQEISLEKPEGTIFLIPLRLDECETPRGLRFFQWTNYFGEQREQSYKDLLEALRIRLDEKIFKEAEEKARLETLERIRLEAEEKARKNAEELTQKRAEQRSRREARARDQKETEEREKIEEEARRQADEKAIQETEEREKREREDAALKLKQLEELAKREADAIDRKRFEEKSFREKEKKVHKKVDEPPKHSTEDVSDKVDNKKVDVEEEIHTPSWIVELLGGFTSCFGLIFFVFSSFFLCVLPLYVAVTGSSFKGFVLGFLLMLAFLFILIIIGFVPVIGPIIYNIQARNFVIWYLGLCYEVFKNLGISLVPLTNNNLLVSQIVAFSDLLVWFATFVQIYLIVAGKYKKLRVKR